MVRMQKLLKDLDINFYSFKRSKIFLAPKIDMKAVIENVKYWPSSPWLYRPFLSMGKSIKEAIEPQIITQTEM